MRLLVKMAVRASSVVRRLLSVRTPIVSHGRLLKVRHTDIANSVIVIVYSP